MPVKMAPHQLAFWQELMAPFHDSDLSEVPARGGKKTLTYIDKRALSNRLDSVCGPNGWSIEYEPTSRGYKARLGIMCPTFNEGTWLWHFKEDGAGFEEMGSKNKETGEFEYDVDNDEKSGYTNAFRRAAQDAWGIGRYLYRKGIPTFLDPNARAGSPLPSIDPGMAAASVPPKELADKAAPPPSTREPARTQGDRPQHNNFVIPQPGKSVFAWAKEMEKAFETSLIDGMGREGESQGWGRQFANWNAQQVNTVCLNAIKFLRELPTYKGQFEHLFPGGTPDQNIPTQTGVGPQPPKPTPGVNIADLRKELLAKMQSLGTRRNGGQPVDNAGLKKIFNDVASSAANEQGHSGEVPESLGKLTDVVWIRNMIVVVDQLIASPDPAEADDECPF